MSHVLGVLMYVLYCMGDVVVHWGGVLQAVFNIEVFNACQMSFWLSKKFLFCFWGTS